MEQDFIKKVFTALPHVESIWVINDKTFYLDGSKGGNKINRSDIEQSKVDKKKKSSFDDQN